MGRWGALVLLMLELCVLPSQRELAIIRCKEEGYFRDPSDCRRFYICTNFNGTRKHLSIFHFTCPEFTAFDDILDVCVWPLDARPPCKFGGGGSDTGTISKASKEIEGTSSGREETAREEGPSLHLQSSNVEERSTIDWHPIKPPANERNPIYSQTSKGDVPTAAPDLGRNLLPSDDSSQSSSVKVLHMHQLFTYDSFKGGSKPIVHAEDRESALCTCAVKPSRQRAESRVTQIITSYVTWPTAIKCKEEGYFRNPNNCRMFYVCTKFNGTRNFFAIFHFICPEFTAFDDILDVCVWPGDARPPCNETNLTFSETASDVGASSKELTKLEISSGTDDATKKEVPYLHYRSSDKAAKFTGSQVLTDTFSATPPSDERNSKYGQIPTGDASTTLPELGRNLPLDGSSESSPELGRNLPLDGSSESSPELGRNLPLDESSESPFVNDLSEDDSGSRVSTEDGIIRTDNDEPNIQYAKSDSRQVTSSGITGVAAIGCKEEGYFRHPYDCRKFYVCTKFHKARKYFTIFHFICPEHTAFDDILDVCVWPSGARPPCKEGGSKVEAADTGNSSV